MSEVAALQCIDVEPDPTAGGGTCTFRESKIDQHAGRGRPLPGGVRAHPPGRCSAGYCAAATAAQRRSPPTHPRDRVQARCGGDQHRGGIGGHSLRVGSDRELAASGASVAELQHAGGWRSPATPEVYIRRDAVARGPGARGRNGVGSSVAGAEMSNSRRPSPPAALSSLQGSAAAAGRPSTAVPVLVRCVDPCRPDPGAPIVAQSPAAGQAATEYRNRSRRCPALVGLLGPWRVKVTRAVGSRPPPESADAAQLRPAAREQTLKRVPLSRINGQSVFQLHLDLPLCEPCAVAERPPFGCILRNLRTVHRRIRNREIIEVAGEGPPPVVGDSAVVCLRERNDVLNIGLGGPARRDIERDAGVGRVDLTGLLHRWRQRRDDVVFQAAVASPVVVAVVPVPRTFGADLQPAPSLRVCRAARDRGGVRFGSTRRLGAGAENDEGSDQASGQSWVVEAMPQAAPLPDFEIVRNRLPGPTMQTIRMVYLLNDGERLELHHPVHGLELCRKKPACA